MNFEDWGATLGDDVMAGALIDRLLHHCHIVNIRGNSYRIRDHQDIWQSLNTSDEPPSLPKRRTKPRKEAVTT